MTARTATPRVAFTSAQNPRTWDPSANFDASVVLTCMTNTDAKNAEQLFNSLLVQIEKLESDRARLIEALRELLRVDDDWHGSINSEMSQARAVARSLLLELEGK